MSTYADKTQENNSQSVANGEYQMRSSGESIFQFVDDRPEAIAQRKLQEMANNSSKVSQLRALQDMTNNSSQTLQAAQLQAMEDNHSAHQQTVQKKENNTGLPDNLKSGIESLSGFDNSPEFIAGSQMIQLVEDDKQTAEDNELQKIDDSSVSIIQKMSEEYIEAQWALARDNMLSMSITLNRIVQIGDKEGQKFAKANEMAESMAKKLRNDSMGSRDTRDDLRTCYGKIFQNLQESLKLESASDLYNSSKHGLSPKITELSGLVVANIKEGINPAINAFLKK